MLVQSLVLICLYTLKVKPDSNQDINIMHSEKDKKGSKKSRFSSEYTMLSILEYLYVNSRKTAVSKYNIVTNTPGIRQQRPDRVNLMMDSLENNGYII